MTAPTTPSRAPLVPMPASYRTRAGTGPSLAELRTVVATDACVGDVVALFVHDVVADGGSPLERHMGSPDGSIRVVLAPDGAGGEGDVGEGDVGGISPSGRDPDDERHEIVVDEDGVEVRARAPEGIHRGLTTVRQLLAAARRTGAPLPACRIVDRPAFAWRGLSLDVVRRFTDLAELRRVLDVCSLHKLNVLHLHLTDDQGWRIEIPALPALTEVGGRAALHDRPGGWYTTEEFRAFVAEAERRFVTVIPEVDLPGHAGAVLRSLPELADGDAGYLHPDHPGVLELVGTVVDAVAQLVPGPHLHLGGDEAFGMDSSAYDRFVAAARRITREAGKRPITWQEGARSELGPDDLLQHWMAFGPMTIDTTTLPDGVSPDIVEHFTTAMEDAARDLGGAVARGARVILSPASHLYLDRPYAEPSADPHQAGLRERLGLPFYPRMSVADAFAWVPDDSLASLHVPPSALAGIEAALWAETIESDADLEFLLLPRLAAVAERAWSPVASEWGELRLRLAAQAPLWERRGWRWFRSSQVPWPS
jgi:hexosaminidase